MTIDEEKEKATKYFENWMLHAFNDGRVEGAKELPLIDEVFYDNRVISWFGKFHGGYVFQVSKHDLECAQ